MLRKLCKKSINNSVEQQVAELLNGLIQTPELIQQPPNSNYQKLSGTQEKLDETLEQQPIDEDQAKVLILQLAAEQYDALGDEEYETVRLRRLFTATKEPSAELLKSVVSEAGHQRSCCLQWSVQGDPGRADLPERKTHRDSCRE